MERVQTEVEQALEIARKTRSNVLLGKKSLENNMRGFYTAAQILGREEDMAWAESELTGYSEEVPEYRLGNWSRRA